MVCFKKEIMKLSFAKKWICFFIFLVLVACDKDFEKINQDPNRLTSDVTPDLLLTAAISSAVSNNVSVGIGLEVGNLVVQHWARVTSLEVDRYIYDATYDAIWSSSYLNALPDLQEVQRLGKESGNVNYEAVALILQSWIYAMLTDIHGDIPYSEAVQGRTGSIFKPKYDPQADIYADLDKQLELANNLSEVAGNTIKGDILFNGDMLRWKKFANSLRLRLLMRQSSKSDAKVDVAAKIAEIVGNPDKFPVFTSVADHAFLRFLANTNNANPFFRLPLDRQNQFRVSKTLVDKLLSINDPRLPVYADLPEDASVDGYVGAPNGVGGNQTATSKPGAAFRQAETPAYLMTYAEVLFIKAEVALRGYVAADASTLYREAVEASFTQHEVAAPTGYFEQPSVAFTSAAGFKLISEQKWIALYNQGIEAWSEWRRTGFPELQAAFGNTNNDLIPVRMIYPLNEQSSNQENYLQAVGRQGENTINTKVWWHK